MDECPRRACRSTRQQALGHGALEVARALRQSIEVFTHIQSTRPADVVVCETPTVDSGLVTVIIPMRNASLWIEHCLKSVLAQTHRNLEIFCVDDSSQDDSYDRVVKQFGKDRRLCAVRLRHRVGPYQIKNWILRAYARGRFVAMQDADDLSHPDRISAQIVWMARRRWRVSGTYVHQFYPEDVRPRFRENVEIRAHGYLHSLAVYTPVGATRASCDFGALLGNKKEYVAHHGSQIFDRSTLLEFGGFDGHTWMGADTDLNWRLLRFADIGNVPEVLYFRRFHHDSLTRDPATGHGSPPRRAYEKRRDAHQQRIVQALARGENVRVRQLCTADLYHSDIEIAHIHTGFNLKASGAP